MKQGSLAVGLLLAGLALAASGAVFANGPMGGGGGPGESHHGNGPAGEPIIVPVPDFTPPSDNVGGTGPEEPGLMPYPPSGPDRTETLIDQINRNGTKRPPKDESTYAKCEDLRARINILENGGSDQTRQSESGALDAQRRFDRYSRMSLQEMDAELNYQKSLLSANVSNDDDDDDDNRGIITAADNVRALLELAKLRERYGNSFCIPKCN